jgi:5,6,7,8-tetrahydromethanopterin hydro-lyase
MFGPAQRTVALAADWWPAPFPSRGKRHLHLVGVFIHWDAADDQKIHDFNYQAVKESIQRAVAGQPSPQEVVQKRNTVKHPFSPK